MAYTGQILENPQTGERLVFHSVADNTKGDYLEFDLELLPVARANRMHIHPKQEERVEVLDGTVKFKLGRRTIVATAGDVVEVPAGTVHKVANGGLTAAHVRVTVTPALKTEELSETICRLAVEGRTRASGMLKLLDLALLLSQFRDEVQAVFPPAIMQRALLAPLVAIAKARGHHRRYDCFRCPAAVAA